MKFNIDVKEGERTNADILHDKRLLKRIQTLIDVVYGLIIFQLFLLLPKPTSELISTDRLGELFSIHGPDFLTVIIGIIWVILYWGQSNTLFGYLKRTNKTLSSLAIVQLFFLLLYLYFIKLDNETDGDVLALFCESVCLAIAGFLGVYFWRYSSKNELLFDELSVTQRYSLYYGFMPEPIAAVLTIPFAFMGVTWYTIAWLSVIPLNMYFKNQAKQKIE